MIFYAGHQTDSSSQRVAIQRETTKEKKIEKTRESPSKLHSVEKGYQSLVAK
jgi:hypothetical protein